MLISLSVMDQVYIQVLWLLVCLASFRMVNCYSEEREYDERLPPAWYTAYVNNDQSYYFLSTNDQETAGRAFPRSINQRQQSDEVSRAGSGRTWTSGGYTATPFASSSTGRGSTHGHWIERLDVAHNGSAYLAVLREPYGPNNVHRVECMAKKCASASVCVAPLGVPRCMPKQCFSAPLTTQYIRPSHSANLLSTIKPLEWQFSRRETLELEMRALESFEQPFLTTESTDMNYSSTAA